MKDDMKMKFYTGISTVAMFNVIFNLISRFLPNIVYWRGAKQVVSGKAKQSFKGFPKRISFF